ncbi:MAG: molecular chaperone DnaJ [Thermotogaceae bacterium]|jgi:molecular chaperone DnaJ|nr:molecular chaperone DnaJ [Thermotogaceae bacterium]HOH54408.1 molecular chaperone DnaJ [Fervidobacterium sp.]
MPKKDYYEILGVSKGASDEEIRAAYKKLVKEWHPDRHAGEDKKLAEQKFKEIQEAYEVLSDPQKRAMYDKFGYVGEGTPYSYENNGNGGFGFEDVFRDFLNEDIFNIFFGGQRTQGRSTGATRAHRSSRRGEDININVSIDESDVFSGKTQNIEYERYEECENCHGEGVEPGSKWVTCSKCHGSGVVKEERRTPFGVFINQYTCDACGGSGTIPGEVCHTCRGTGRVRRRASATVNIPAGVEDGAILKFSRKGNAGTNGGEYGDLYIHVNIRKVSDYEREGDDIIANVHIDYVTAILGGEVTVTLPNNEEVEIEIPAGIQPNETVVVRGKGYPNVRNGRRGNFVAKVIVDIPRKISSKERELLKEIAKMKGVKV